MKIADHMKSRENSFDLLRFFAASLVIFSHSFPLFGIDAQEPLRRLSKTESFGDIAVIIFFVISGFLIGKSWIERPMFFVFAWNRFLRIFPGFFCAIFFAVFVVGPITTTLNFGEYIKNPQLIEYAKSITMFPIRFALPGVFEKNIYPTSVNGSLWTLPMELLMYAGVVFLGLMGAYKNKLMPLVMTVLLVALNILVIPKLGMENELFLYMPLIQFLKFSGYFAAGLCAYVYRDFINLNKWIAVFSLFVWIASFGTSFMDLVSFMALPYVILYLGFSKIIYGNVISKYGDFSYGMYIYAFPVQQMIMHFYGEKITFSVFFLLAYLLSLVMGVLSWHLIEKRALKLKKVILVVYENKFISFCKSFWANLKFKVMPE
jgi:peptidoglycan/LPS O-acetylase OafA/YrhL